MASKTAARVARWSVALGVLLLCSTSGVSAQVTDEIRDKLPGLGDAAQPTPPMPSQAPDRPIPTPRPATPPREVPGAPQAVPTPGRTKVAPGGGIAITGYRTLKSGTDACAGEKLSLVGSGLGRSQPSGQMFIGQGSGATGRPMHWAGDARWPEVLLPAQLAPGTYWLALNSAGRTIAKGPETLRIVPCAVAAAAGARPNTDAAGPFRVEWNTGQIDVLDNCERETRFGEWRFYSRVSWSLDGQGRQGEADCCRVAQPSNGDSIRFPAWYSEGGIPAGADLTVEIGAVECDRRRGLDPNLPSHLRGVCTLGGARASEDGLELGGAHDFAGAHVYQLSWAEWQDGGRFEPTGQQLGNCRANGGVPFRLRGLEIRVREDPRG